MGDNADLCDKIDEAKTVKDQPVMIMANTVKARRVVYGRQVLGTVIKSVMISEQALKELGGK